MTIARHALSIGLILALVLGGAGNALAGPLPAAPAATAATTGSTIRLLPAGLAIIAEGNPALSFGSAATGRATIGWSHRADLGRRRTLVRFDLSGVPASAQIVGARLVAQVGGSSGLPTLEATAAPLLSAWKEGVATWERQPARAEEYAQTTLGTAGRAEWDVTIWAQAWLASPRSNFGLALDSLAAFPEDNERTLTRLALELTLAAETADSQSAAVAENQAVAAQTTLTLAALERRDPVPAGDFLEYQLTLANTGAIAAQSPIIKAVLPPRTRFVSCTDGCTYGLDQAGKVQATWNLADLASGRSYRVFLRLQVGSDAPTGSHLILTAQAGASNSALAKTQADTTVGGATAATPTPSPAGCDSERVVNGDFELFEDGWWLGGENRPIITASPVHGGTYSLLLGSTDWDVPGQSIARQSVRIPADAGSARFTFWYSLSSDENDARYDWFDVRVLDPAGRPLQLLLTQSRATNWRRGSFDLTAYRGQTVQVVFRVQSDGNAGVTLAYLDDVSLCVARPEGPEPATAPLPGMCKSPANLVDYAPAGVPDFSVRQSESWKYPLDSAWSFDGPLAAADALWWLDSLHEPGAIPPPAISDGYPLVQAYSIWDDHAPENVPWLVDTLAYLADTDGMASGLAHAGTSPQDLQTGLLAYLAQEDRDLAASWDVNLMAAPSPYVVRANLEQDYGVILLLGFWQWNAGVWERLGGRYVTAAGIGCQDDRVLLSDPLRDAAELGYAGDVLPTPDHAHPAYPPYPPDDVHNDAARVSHDAYAPAQIDDGWGLVDYARSLDDIADSLGHNFAADQLAPAAPNPNLTLATRVEYALIIWPRGATAANAQSLSAAGTLHVQVSEEGRPPAPHASWTIPLLVTLQRPGDVAPTALFSTQTDEQGRTTVQTNVAPGDWEVGARGGHTLGLVQPWANLAAGDNALALHTLAEGDANADNQVAIQDLSLLAAGYGGASGNPGFDARVDFNQDGVVDGADLALWARNQGRLGDTAAQTAPAQPLRVERLSNAGLQNQGTIVLTLAPSDTKTAVGRVFPVQLSAAGFLQEIDAAEIHLDFDATRVQIVNAAGQPVTELQPAGGPSTVVWNRVDNQAGRIDFVAAQLQAPYPSNMIDLATFHVKAVAPASRTWVRFSVAPGRRSAVARAGDVVSRSFLALGVTIEGSATRLPLLFKR